MEYKYLGLRFRQREDGPELVQFLAPAEDIGLWGGVPQKSSKFLKGFQRAEDPKRKLQIYKFFDQPANISPTAIVVAFKPNCLTMTDLPVEFPGGVLDGAVPIGTPVLITVTYEPLESETIPFLAEKVFDLFNGGEVLSTLEVQELGEDTDEDTTIDIEDEVEEKEELSIRESHLKEFLTFLSNPVALDEAAQEDEVKLRTILTNLLKPGIIVDGQHRTRGAAYAERRIPFPVVGLVDAGWKEQVFQFIIINQKAKPIQPEFLTAIISSSFSANDIEDLVRRLENSGIKLEESRLTELINYDQKSPFAGMIDLKIQGMTGSLGYPGMIQLSKRFKGLKTHLKTTQFRAVFETVFKTLEGSTYTVKRSHWDEQEWFEYFCAFWSTVSKKYEDLWEPGTNLMKIVSLQELQNVFLEWLYERRESINGVDDFREKTELFLTNLQSGFFHKDWKLVSLQSATGRRYLREALNNATKRPRYRYDDALFRGVTE